jgi:hypothetical protein
MLSSIVLGALESKKHYVPIKVGDKIAMDKKMWFTITGISKRLLNKRNSLSMYNNGNMSEKNQTLEHVGMMKDNNGLVDLHKGEFCVDVSTYGQIEYDNAKIEVCDSTFAKQCTNKYKEVILKKYKG